MDRAETARRGEDAAVAYLERIGMTIEARNWRCASGEIDIVARDDGELVFIEVKTRRTERTGTPDEAVTPAKQRRVARVADAYLRAESVDPDSPVRFDAVAIRVLAPDRALLRHHRAAFDLSS
jgi:putative endonuclease